MQQELIDLGVGLGRALEIKRLAPQTRAPWRADGPLDYQFVGDRGNILFVLSFRERGGPVASPKRAGLHMPPVVDIRLNQRAVAIAASEPGKIRVVDLSGNVLGEVTWRYSFLCRKIRADIAGAVGAPIELASFSWQLDRLVIKKRSGRKCVIMSPNLESSISSEGWATHRIIKWTTKADCSGSALENLFFILIAYFVDHYDYVPWCRRLASLFE
jgi:hypothetical protein